MYLRCAECHDATWIPNLAPGVSELTVGCKRCGRVYALADKHGSGQERYTAAMQCAESNQLDLPSAYSILFGVMTLEQAKEFRDGREAKANAGRRGSSRSRASSAMDAPAVALAFDPAFEPAVEQGHLTPKQAIERGDRQAFAARLATRHALPLQLAYEVADNRLTVREALVKKPRPKPEIILPPEPATKSQLAFVATLAGVLAVAVGLFGWAMWQRELSDARVESEVAAPVERPAPPRAPAAADMLSLADVRTDRQGRLTRVTGPNPRTVLLAFCKTNPRTAMLEPLGLSASIPPYPGSQLGLFRDIENNNTIRAISIRKNGQTGRWVAGTGRRPIVTRQFDELPSDTYEVAGTR